MKNWLTALVLLVTGICISQNVVKGIVKDITTNKNIELVTVSTSDLQYNTISNSEGAFQLTYPEGTEKIVLNYLGYASYEIAINSLPTDNIFYLEPKNIDLDEIIILNTPIHEFVDGLVKNSYNTLNAPFLLSTYYREFVKINDRYTKFSDALIDYNVEKKRKKVESEVVVKQSRAVKLDMENEEEIDMTSPLDLRNAVAKDCNFTPVFSIFEKKKCKDYKFIIKSQQGTDGKRIETIYFSPLEDVEEPLFEGSLAYDPEKKLILSIDVYMAPSHKKYSKLRNFLIVKARLDDIAYKSFFKITDSGNYMLSYSCRSGNVYLKNKKRFDDNIIFKSDLIVTNFSSDLLSFNNKEKYNEKGLYQRGNNYSEDFWLSNNSILLTDEEEQIIKNIQNKQ
ncbi:carboxypeptidase-like regulatory domain-containing protein [Flavobacterium sp. LaA7.5]|nr:carboxypeptidase-like regulatory domain-containing protein [Flavobacterium salilacus subsp. altitudinum]